MSTVDKVRMTLRLTEEENERLEQYARANRLTKTGAIRQLLELALFADEALNMDITDPVLGGLIADGQALSVEKLHKATDLGKNKMEYLTPQQSSELINSMGKLRGSIDAYKNELSQVGNNINQIARKYNSTDSFDGESLMRNLKVTTDNLRGMKSFVSSMSEKVEKLWDMVR